MRQRLLLMGLAAWDAATLYLSYNMTYRARIGGWEGLNLGLVVITGTWLGASYILGRYSTAPSGKKNPVLSRLLETSVTCLSIFAVFIGHSWVYGVVDAETRFRGFLVPVVLTTAAISSLAQGLIGRLDKGKKEWIVFGERDELDVIRAEVSREKKSLRERTRTETLQRAVNEIEENTNSKTGIGLGTMRSDEWRLSGRLLKEREKGRTVIGMCDWCERELQRIPPELVNNEWLIQAGGFALLEGSLSWRIKRFGDFIGAMGLLAVTSPLVGIAALAIWLEDGGPVFYSQTRTGLRGKSIKIRKLRSMTKNAEKNGAQWAKSSDPRITRVGRVIRSTRIDELPQLVSVLNGDLSLIGPRPERPEIEEGLVTEIPYYRIRYWIRPGLSGWAQVSYPYGASIEDSRMKLAYDIYYLRNAGFLLDMLILMKTVKLVSRREGSIPNGDKKNG